jgi:hypothetical protein
MICTAPRCRHAVTRSSGGWNSLAFCCSDVVSNHSPGTHSLTHKHTRTLTHTLSHSFSLFLSLSLSLPLWNAMADRLWGAG